MHNDIFQSTLPVKGATVAISSMNSMGAISIHAPREGSDVYGIHAREDLFISIHAPREGSDDLIHLVNVRQFYFNPRSP